MRGRNDLLQTEDGLLTIKKGAVEVVDTRDDEKYNLSEDLCVLCAEGGARD